MNGYTNFEDRITEILAHDWDITRGDAQGLVEALTDEVLKEFRKGSSPMEAFENIWGN